MEPEAIGLWYSLTGLINNHGQPLFTGVPSPDDDGRWLFLCGIESERCLSEFRIDNNTLYRGDVVVIEKDTLEVMLAIEKLKSQTHGCINKNF